MGEKVNDVKIAVMMSVYHRDSAAAFKKAVKSIFNQTISCDLYLFVDGTVGEDIEIQINQLSDLSNCNVIFSKSNLGLATGLNILIDKILQKDYSYIARMDSDDVSYPMRLERQLAYLLDNPDVDVLGTFVKEFGSQYAVGVKKLPVTHDQIINFSIARCPLVHPTVMMRRKVFDAGHRYNEKSYLTEDLELWHRLLLAGLRFANIDEVLLDFKMSSETMTRRRGIQKSWSEFYTSFKFMLAIRKLSMKNLSLILGKFMIQLLPVHAIKLYYLYMR